jgi:hypothetical protein
MRIDFEVIAMTKKVDCATKAGNAVGELLSDLLAIGIFCTLIYVFVLPVVGSFIGFQMKMDYYSEGCGYSQCVRKGFGYERADAAQRLKESRDRVAASLCPTYHQAGVWGQRVVHRNLSWCEAYPQYDVKK